MFLFGSVCLDNRGRPCSTGLITAYERIQQRKLVNKFMVFADVSMHLAGTRTLRILTEEIFGCVTGDGTTIIPSGFDKFDVSILSWYGSS